MHDLKMTDKFAKNNGDWNITDWKLVDLIMFSVMLSSLLNI